MSWVTRAKPGDNVACIKQGSWVEAKPGLDNEGIFPEFGEVYVIGQIKAEDDEVFLWLVGIDGWYWSERFRPLTPRRADISFAHEILRKASEPVRERA